jgi:hypothetical protein
MDDGEYNEYRTYLERKIYPGHVLLGTSQRQIKGKKEKFP